MRILLVNPPHPSIGSGIPFEHLPPLGLLSIGGPLIDAGHEVKLLDAELGPMSVDQIVRQVATYAPDAVLISHSGSTSGHPIISRITRLIRRLLAKTWIIYGGVFPTYHWREILTDEPQINIIVRGEGEATIVQLIEALEANRPLQFVLGIAFWEYGRALATPPAPLIKNLDTCRIGWELIDFRKYTYWGDRRAVVAQFSRGCPNRCNYCGQQGFWTQWRHRDPRQFAAELARLYRNHGVEVINFADENPTASRDAWREFLEALIAENVPLILVGSTRADDIIRDADILHLYKKAGVVRFLLDIEKNNADTLRKIHKDESITKNRQAIELLRQHDIISMASYLVGFEEENDNDYKSGLKQLLFYDPDQIQTIYFTPHRWTPYYRKSAKRKIIQTDQTKWDYKHQVLANQNMPAWRVLLWVKFIEAVMQLRPKSLWRLFRRRDRSIRAGMRWYYHIGRKVWFYEIWNFLFKDRHLKKSISLEEFWGEPQDEEQEAMEIHNQFHGNFLPARDVHKTRKSMASINFLENIYK